MTLGEKIAKQRKDTNYTQEQLAELLGVSRQAVSKWEANVAYPETDKLIRMGKLFDCSMDYLLYDDCTDKSGKAASDAAVVLGSIVGTVRRQFHERKSKKTVWGLPLYHIGRNAKGFFAIGLNARGIFAVGLKATGLVSLGLLSMGLLSFGTLSLGLIALGAFAFGLLSVGSIAVGLFAAGAIAIGIVSFGACSIGLFSGGALAIGHYIAVGDHARAMIAIGGRDAAGTLYQYIGSKSSADLTQAAALLDGQVPGYLEWAKALFKLFLL